MKLRLWLLKKCCKALCNDQLHFWTVTGSRACPYPGADENMRCSQPVYQCARCETFDHGEVGGEGWKSCSGCDLRTELV